MSNSIKNIFKTPNRRNLLKVSGAAVLTTPFVSRAWAATTEINMLACMTELMSTVKFK